MELLRRFLYEQINPNTAAASADILLDACPSFVGAISVFNSAIARFYAPSNLCGASGMYHEHIHSNPNWRREYARYDMMFVETGSTACQAWLLAVHACFSHSNLGGKSILCTHTLVSSI